jgi:hypothetical protein
MIRDALRDYADRRHLNEPEVLPYRRCYTFASEVRLPALGDPNPALVDLMPGISAGTSRTRP